MRRKLHASNGRIYSLPSPHQEETVSFRRFIFCPWNYSLEVDTYESCSFCSIYIIICIVDWIVARGRSFYSAAVTWYKSDGISLYLNQSLSNSFISCHRQVLPEHAEEVLSTHVAPVYEWTILNPLALPTSQNKLSCNKTEKFCTIPMQAYTFMYYLVLSTENGNCQDYRLV